MLNILRFARRRLGLLFNTTAVNENTYGVFEISFGVLHFSAGKLGVQRHKHKVYPLTPHSNRWECLCRKGLRASEGWA